MTNQRCDSKIEKSDKTIAITVLDPKKIYGYKLKGKNKDKDSNKIIITKKDFAKKIADKNIKKKINILTYRLNVALSEDDDDATSRVLGEAEMLKAMIISMYSSYLGAEYIDKVIKNINYLVSEFVRAKTFQNSFASNEIKDTRRR